MVLVGLVGAGDEHGPSAFIAELLEEVYRVKGIWHARVLEVPEKDMIARDAQQGACFGALFDSNVRVAAALSLGKVYALDVETSLRVDGYAASGPDLDIIGVRPNKEDFGPRRSTRATQQPLARRPRAFAGMISMCQHLSLVACVAHQTSLAHQNPPIEFLIK